MTDDLKRIEKSGSESIAALRSILTALEITNTLRENESKILPLVGETVEIITLEPERYSYIAAISYPQLVEKTVKSITIDSLGYRNITPIKGLRVTELSTAVLRSQMEALRRLDPSKELIINVSDNQGTPVITISLVDSGRT